MSNSSAKLNLQYLFFYRKTLSIDFVLKTKFSFVSITPFFHPLTEVNKMRYIFKYFLSIFLNLFLLNIFEKFSFFLKISEEIS